MTWLNLVLGAVTPPACSAIVSGAFRRWTRFIPGWISAAVTIAIVDAVMSQWPYAAGAAASLALAVFLWWFNRRRRDRAKAWLGAKSRALRDALVRRQREVWKPRPVLRPAPRDAR